MKGESDSFIGFDLEKCMPISDIKADDISVDVTYTEKGEPFVLKYDSQTLGEGINAFISFLVDSKQLPKKFIRTYSKNVLTIDIELQSLCEFRSSFLEDY